MPLTFRLCLCGIGQFGRSCSEPADHVYISTPLTESAVSDVERHMLTYAKLTIEFSDAPAIGP